MTSTWPTSRQRDGRDFAGVDAGADRAHKQFDRGAARASLPRRPPAHGARCVSTSRRRLTAPPGRTLTTARNNSSVCGTRRGRSSSSCSARCAPPAASDAGVQPPRRMGRRGMKLATATMTTRSGCRRQRLRRRQPQTLHRRRHRAPRAPCNLHVRRGGEHADAGVINAENLEIVELGVASGGTLHAVAANMSTSALPRSSSAPSTRRRASSQSARPSARARRRAALPRHLPLRPGEEGGGADGTPTRTSTASSTSTPRRARCSTTTPSRTLARLGSLRMPQAG